MPKFEEDDFVEPTDLPPISRPRYAPPTGDSGYGSGNYGNYGNYNSSSYGNYYGTQNQQPTPTANPDRNAAAPSNAASDAEILVANSKQSEDWINKKWRPAMGWMYMAVCITDFILFPILWSILQALSKGQVTSQWQPLTLQGAGLFHIAMGAVLGIAVYGRTREKVEGINK